MFKKFFVAMILGLLVMSSQIVSAADIDWNSAPKIGSKAQLANYIEEGRLKGQKVFYFIFPSVKIRNDQEREAFRIEIAQSNAIPYCLLDVDGGFGTGRFIFTITRQDFIGTRVANAYLNGYISELTPNELELYRKALPIVNEAKKYSSERKKARYIHDEICKHVLEYKVENERNKTAIGALIDHKAQCQGYSDAFYMLGVMSGLNVRRIGGKVDGVVHVWNTITLSNGKSYCVDVTQDDDGNYSHKWFLATYERMKAKYSCDWSVIPNL